MTGHDKYLLSFKISKIKVNKNHNIVTISAKNPKYPTEVWIDGNEQLK